MCPPSRRCGNVSRVIRIRPCTFVSARLLVLLGRVVERVAPEGEPGVVDEDVDPAEPPPPRGRSARGGRVGDVELERESASTRSRPRAAGDADASARSARSIAAPIPLEAPVTIAVLPSSCTRRPGRLDQSRRVLDLKRRVGQLEALPQQRVELAPDRVAVGPGGDEHVRESAGKPEVIVQRWRSWTPTTPGSRRSRRPPRARPSRRRALEQDADRLAEDAEGADDDEDADQEPAIGSACGQPVVEHDEPGDDDARRGGEVGEHVQHRRARSAPSRRRGGRARRRG